MDRPEEISAHQQRFIADETLPAAGIAIGIAAEIEAAEDLDQRQAFGEMGPMPAQQLKAGIPVVVPTSLAFEGINDRWARPPAAVVLHRGLEGSAVAASHIPDHSVDVKQQQLTHERLPDQGQG